MQNIITAGFETPSLRLTPMWQITYIAAAEDIDRIYDAIRAITPLVHGKTDNCAYRTNDGFEYYRPTEGTPTGAEDEVRKRPGVDEIRVCIPRDTEVLTQVIEAIYQVTSYYEPMIFVEDLLRSATKGVDDSDNPNRWWNKGGDWKKD